MRFLEARAFSDGLDSYLGFAQEGLVSGVYISCRGISTEGRFNTREWSFRLGDDRWVSLQEIVNSQGPKFMLIIYQNRDELYEDVNARIRNFNMHVEQELLGKNAGYKNEDVEPLNLSDKQVDQRTIDFLMEN